MKKLFLIVPLFLILTGCQSATPKGKCIGAFDTEVPGLTYRVSKRNAILMFFFPPISIIYTVLIEIKCPV